MVSLEEKGEEKGLMKGYAQANILCMKKCKWELFW